MKSALKRKPEALAAREMDDTFDHIGRSIRFQSTINESCKNDFESQAPSRIS